MIDFLLTALGVLGVLFLTFLCSGTETAHYRASPVRLRVLARAGSVRAARVGARLASLPRLVVDVLVAGNLLIYAATYLPTVWLERSGVAGAEWWATLAMTPALFLFGEMLPKRLACDMAESWALASDRILTVARAALWPLTRPLAAAMECLRRRMGASDAGGAEDPRARLMAHFTAGVSAHALTPAQLVMSRRIMALESLSAFDVVTAMARAAVVPADALLPEAARALRAEGWGAALVVDARGRPIGTEVTLRTLWRHAAAAAPSGVRTAGEAGRPVPRLKSETPFPEMLETFRLTRARLALVEDPRGRALGAVSVESLLRRVAEPPAAPPGKSVRARKAPAEG